MIFEKEDNNRVKIIDNFNKAIKENHSINFRKTFVKENSYKENEFNKEKRFGDKTIYLKHKIENSIVTESYVCIEKNEYDRNVNTFSNQGRLYQVEYAMKAVEQGCTTLGIHLKDGIILGAEKKIASKLQMPSSIENIMKINENTICTYSGLRADARALIETARVEAANHWFNFNEEMPVEAISLAVCDASLSFADKKKKDDRRNEKRVVSRPYGVAMLIAGIDSDGEPRLFKNDPSGNYVSNRFIKVIIKLIIWCKDTKKSEK